MKLTKKRKSIQRTVGLLLQRRPDLEEDNLRMQKARHQLDASLAEDQARAC